MNVKQALQHKDELGEGAKRRRQLKTRKEIMEAVLLEFRRGTLRAGSGEHVTDRKQALAIALSEARKHKEG